MAAHILALDQGTTSSRAIVFRKNGTPVASAQREFDQLYPLRFNNASSALNYLSFTHNVPTSAINLIRAPVERTLEINSS